MGESDRDQEPTIAADVSGPPKPREATISGEERTIAAMRSSGVSATSGSVPALVTDLGAELTEQSFSQRYRRLKSLGRGGMGEVRLMKDSRTGRGVAMKLIHEERGSSSSARVRFLWEARVQAQLEHPAVVPVYDMGLTEEGSEYFTMKRIGGRTLADILSALRAGDEATIEEYPRNKLLGAFRQVCLALEYAHRRGVIHRDIKPDNLMLGELGEVYVLDWGLAKVGAVEQPASDEQPEQVLDRKPHGQSVAGSVMGTPAYMAPEQARGMPDLDQRADVYALGTVLFELLTLEPFHRGDNVLALIREAITGVDAAERFADHDVPPELAALTAAATRVDREDRLSSAQGLADGVQLFLDGDRDAEMRSQMADDHALRAEQAAERALGEGGVPEDRERALAEAGRALAIDPSSTRAAATMMRLLLEPPEETPEEVERMMAKEDAGELRAIAKQGTITYIVNGLVAILSGFILGFESYVWIAAIVVPQWLAAILCWHMSRREAVAGIHVVMVAVVAFTAIAADSGIAGPLILVPGYAASQLVVLSNVPSHKYRFVIMALAILAVLIPTGLEYSGWVTPAYEFLDTGLRVNPRAVGLPWLALPLGVVAAIVTSLVGPAIVVWQQNAKLIDTRRQNHTQAWMLRQLVPKEVRSSQTQSSG